MKIRWRETRPGQYRIYFFNRDEGKQVFLQRGLDDKPLRSLEQVNETIAYLILKGYKPSDWGKDNSFLFKNALQTWISFSNCSPEWLGERKRLAETLFIPFFGKKDIREIKGIHIDEFQKKLQGKGLSAKYTRNILGELKAFFRFNRKSLPELPEFRKIEVQKPAIRWLSESDQDKVFELIPDKHLPIFTFLRFYGCRLNEACGVLRKNVFLSHDTPYVTLSDVIGKMGQLKNTTKTKIVRVLPIITETEWLFKPTEVTPFLFSHGGKPYTSKKLYRGWERANKKANKTYGVQILNVRNATRHSWACQRLNAGFSLDQISTVLGHTSTQMTKRYAEYAVEKLGSVIRGERSVHTLITLPKTPNILNLNRNMVGGTGIEPATSGL